MTTTTMSPTTRSTGKSTTGFGLLACVTLCSTLAGCFWVTTKAEGKQIKTEVANLDQRVTAREKSFQTKMKELQRVLDEAQNLMARNSANLGDVVKTLERDISKIKGLVNEVKRYTDDLRLEIASLKKANKLQREILEKRVSVMLVRLIALESKAAGPQTAADMWTAAKKGFDGGDYDSARRYFKLIVIRYPSFRKADEAQYYRGESYMRQKKFELAISEFQKMFDAKYKKSRFADDAMFRAGEAAETLKHCSEARAYYSLLRQRFPKSSLAKKSLARAKILKKNSSNKKYCVK